MQSSEHETPETPSEMSGKAVASFVFGLLSLFGCFLPPLPIVAIALGWGERDGLGRAGFVLGWIGVGVWAIVAMLALLFLLVGGAGAVMSS